VHVADGMVLVPYLAAKHALGIFADNDGEGALIDGDVPQRVEPVDVVLDLVQVLSGRHMLEDVLEVGQLLPTLSAVEPAGAIRLLSDPMAQGPVGAPFLLERGLRLHLHHLPIRD